MKLYIILLQVTLIYCDVDSDSYLSAYKELHKDKPINKISKSKINREYNSGFANPESYPNGYFPSSQPIANEAYPSGPANQYGPSTVPQYGHPAPSYGSLVPNYGPPPSSYQYGPPVVPLKEHKPFYGIPYAAALSFIDKIKWKLDLFTVGKILLKLVIFKKIVSLIGILCLLLFIPSLKKKHFFSTSHDEAEENEEDMRSTLKEAKFIGNKNLNKLTKNVFEAIEKHSKKFPSQ